jgi:hypothetical protein
MGWVQSRWRQSLATSTVVSTETERVTGGVHQDPDVLLRLLCSHRGSQGDRVSDGGIQISDLEVEVHHRALRAVDGRPHRGSVVTGLLEHDVDRALRSRE